MIDRQDLDPAFMLDEAKKSDLLIRAQLLRAHGQAEEAAGLFAQAATLEEDLSARCVSAGKLEKSQIHLFSAASSWAQAGNFYQAITWCKELLRADLSAAYREQIENYAKILTQRRAQWYSELIEAG